MIEKATSPASIHAMLRTIATHQAEASSGLGSIDLKTTEKPSAPGFTDAVQQALQQVNSAQLQSSELQERYERGEGIPLTDVVIGMQKSSLAFETTLQVRNKVLKAYEDILNMPV